MIVVRVGLIVGGLEAGVTSLTVGAGLRVGVGGGVVVESGTRWVVVVECHWRYKFKLYI